MLFTTSFLNIIYGISFIPLQEYKFRLHQIFELLQLVSSNCFNWLTVPGVDQTFVTEKWDFNIKKY